MNLFGSINNKLRRIQTLHWVALLIVAAILSMSIFMIWIHYNDEMTSAEISAINHAKVLQVQYDASFRRLGSVLVAIAGQIPEQALLGGRGQAYDEVVQTILGAGMIDFPEVTAIRVVDVKGDMRYSSPYSDKRGVNVLDREFFTEQRANPVPHLFFSSIITSRVTGEQTMIVSRGIRNAKGEFLGVVTAGMSVDLFQTQFRKLNVGTHGSIAIRRTDNLGLVVRWPHIPAEVNKTLSPDNLIRLKINRGEKQFSTHMQAQTDGRQRIFGVARLEQYPFFVTVAYKTSEVLANWRKQSLLIGAATLGIVLLLLELLRRYSHSQESEFAALRDLAKNQSRVRLLAQVFENSGEAIFLLDKQERILEVNRAYTRLTGYTLSHLLQQPWQAFLQPFEPEGSARLDGPELVCLRQDGSRFPVLHTCAGFLDEEGDLAYTIITFNDNTERKREDQMKSEFVSTVSHELRTPLTSICGGLGLLVGGALGNLPVTAMKIITIAHTNSLRLSVLINDLLDMEKLVAGKMDMHLASQTLMPLVDAAIEMNQAYAVSHQVSLHVVQREDEVQVRVDAARLGQVLSNLISNAAKFSDGGSRVEVRVTVCAGLDQGQSQRRVRVSVQDYGIGVPLEFRERIFQKFAQADGGDTRQHSGTGLGLAISKQLIEKMQGEIGFDSEVGQGSVFYFELPVVFEKIKTL
jgi:PAS domain S-box-containing protein